MTELRKTTSFIERVNMDTKDRCEQSIKNGWIAALFYIWMILIISPILFFMRSYNEIMNYLLDPLLMINVVLISVMAFFIYKKSRAASTLMIIYFIILQVVEWYFSGSISGVLWTIIIMYFFFNSMVGTFIWHSKYKNNEEQSPYN